MSAVESREVIVGEGLTGRVRRTILVAVLGLVALVAGAFVAAPADAAAPQIVNSAEWLEALAVSGGPGDPPGGGRLVTVSLMVKHDVGRQITGIRIDDDYNGTDSAATATLRTLTAAERQQPSIVGGYDYTRVTYSYSVPKGGDVDCPFVGSGSKWEDRPLRIVAEDNSGQKSASLSRQLRFVRYDCNAREDAPVLYQAGQNKTAITPGETVNFTFTADDSDGGLTANRDFGGIEYRLRRLSDGKIVSGQKLCFGNSDNTQRNFNVTFPDRGRWVVEAILWNNNTCDYIELSGTWFRIGGVDVNSPQASSPTISLAATRPMLNGSTTVTATVDDPADAGQGGVGQDIQWDLDNNGVWDNASLGDWLTGLTAPQRQRTINTAGMTPGLHTVKAQVGDNGALGGADTIRRTNEATVQFLVDSPPVAANDLKKTNTNVSVPVTLAGTDADGDALTWSIVTDPGHGTLTGSAASRTYHPDTGFAGTDSFTFKVDDGWGGTDTATVTVEVYPDVTSFVHPSGTVDSRGAEFGFDSNATGATFECKLDTGAWAACTSPHSLTDLADGTHTMSVRARAGGLTTQAADVVTATWVVDTAPKVTITEQPPLVTADTGATVKFTATEAGITAPLTTDCKLDSGSWATCTSPVSYSGLGSGPHTIEVRATDAYGKQASKTVTWEIGNNPVAADDTVRTVTDQDLNITLNAVHPGGDPLTYSIETPPASGVLTCTPVTGPSCVYDPFAGFAGTDTFVFKAADTALPALNDTATVTVNVFPDLKNVNGPSGTKNSRSATVTFDSGATGATFECRTDGGSWTICTSPVNLTDLADGSHTVEMRAIAGGLTNTVDVGQVTWDVEVDPVLTIDSAPSGTIGSDTATVEFTASEAGTTVPLATDCRLDGGSWAPCTSPHTMTGLSSGDHTLRVRATNAFGDEVFEDVAWRVNTPPVAGNDTVSTVTGNPVSVTLPGSDADGDPLTWSIVTQPGDGVLTGTAASRSYDPDPDFAGTDSFTFKVTDSFGASATGTITINVAPNLVGPNGVTGTVASRAATVTFSSAASGATFECRVDGGTWAPCTSPLALQDLIDGPHTVRVKALAGGLESTVGEIEWTVDAQPTVTIDAAPSGSTEETSADVYFTVSSPGSTATPAAECSLDNGDWEPCASPVSYSDLAPGQHTVLVRVTDTYGKQATATTTWTVTEPVLPDPPDPTPPDGGTGVFDGKNLHIRLKCPARFKPKCNIRAAFPVTGKGKKAKNMARNKIVKQIKSNRWINVSFLIKPKFRKTVEKMAETPNVKKLFVRMKIRSKRINRKKFRGKPRMIHHKYKVRTSQ